MKTVLLSPQSLVPSFLMNEGGRSNCDVNSIRAGIFYLILGGRGGGDKYTPAQIIFRKNENAKDAFCQIFIYERL